ncbi:MAG: ketose-bisphosphate aldolase [Firmicutes bacterium]|nr:ketose-bisphosphate aldolase [Bacillota bacterium]
MYKYSDLGFVNTKHMFDKAYRNAYAVPALNFISIEQLNAIIDACSKKNSPVILLASPNLRNQLGYEMIARIAQASVDRLKNEGHNIPIALHLDHGMSYEQCVSAIEGGFSSVMIDGSTLPFTDNVALTKMVVDYAHEKNVSVEGELGILSGAEEEDYEVNNKNIYTDPSMVEEFVKHSGVDSLAISIGTCHGLAKLKPNSDGTLPELRYDILEDIQHRLPGFPIVLHGASTILPKYVEMINTYGGKLEQAIGIPEEQISKAAKMAVCKVNIASDGWIAALALTRKILAGNPSIIDSRKFTLKVRPELAELYEHKIDIMGSENMS